MINEHGVSQPHSKLKSLPPIVLLLVAAFFGVPSLVQPARATTTGLVCITDQSLNPTDCPAEPANLTGNVGDIITVAVNVQGADSLIGFDIRIQVNPAVLQPVSISLSDSLIQEPLFVLRQSANSTSGIAWVAMVALSRIVIGSGNLFDINYKVLSSSAGTPLTFMLGCLDSVSSTPGICVTLANPTLVYVTVQTADFGSVTPDFSITAFFALRFVNPALPFPKSEMIGPINSENVNAGFAATVGIILGSNDKFNGTVNLSIALAPLCLSGTCPSASLDSTTQSLSSGGSAWTTFMFSAPPGQFSAPVTYWSINVTGTNVDLSHSAVVSFKVLPPDFSISAGSISGLGEPNANATITLRSLGGFGTINLIVDPICSASTCPTSTWNLSPASLTLSAGDTAQTTLTFSAPPPPDALTTAVTYYGSITAVSGNWSRSIVVDFSVYPRNFTITVDPLALSVVRGQSVSATVKLFSFFKTSLSVSISPSINKDPSVTLRYFSGHFGSGYILLVSTNNTTHPGAYTVTVTASNDWFTHTATLTLVVVPNANDPSKIH